MKSITRTSFLAVLLTAGIALCDQAHAAIGVAELIAELVAFFKDRSGSSTSSVKPTVEVDNQPCSIHLRLLQFPGVYGNGDYSASDIRFNDYWTGSLIIHGAEGFVQRDFLQIQGSVKHVNDQCDQHETDAGVPLVYQFNINLNEAPVRNLINATTQMIELDAPQVPHEDPHLSHWDRLTHATVTANTFRNQREIGLYFIGVDAIHTQFTIPESSTLVNVGLGLIALVSVMRRKAASLPAALGSDT